MKQQSQLLLVLTVFSLFACQSVREKAVLLPPDPNRFTTSIISEPGSLDEPMAFTFLDEKEMLIVERKGGVKAFNVEHGIMRSVAQVPVNTKYVNKEGHSRDAEEGLMGIIAHPNYQDNHWIFMLYADPEEPKHVLARWEFWKDSLYDDSKKVVLEYFAQREVCCHTGGGMAFDKAGNLYLTTGNNTANPPRGTSNLDERPGYKVADDQRTSGNTNDLRGKILRIHPEDDGTYTIPEGNLFPEGTAGARPEIYTMGHRNPWRISVDSKTGYIYWGEVGPDASEDTEYGPQGYDEFNQAKGPGFFGWPYFVGDNKPYMDYDFVKDSIGQPFDPSNPINESPNNTGLTQLPPAEKAFIWYPYGYSEVFPLLGSAGRSATGGPIFRQQDFPASDKVFPAYYEGKWLMVEFMRAWIIAVEMDQNGDYVSMEPFLPQENFSSAIDMQFGPDGTLYVLEYGSAWFRGNDNAQVKRIQYNGGNRPPVVKASADRLAGALPLEIQLSSDGTVDYDDDPLTYHWSVSSDNGFSASMSDPNPALKLEQKGQYEIQLTVTDAKGNSNRHSLDVVAGNAPPEVAIEISKGNQSFFFPGSEIKYEIKVEDQEDGNSESGTIPRAAIAVNFDYVPEGFDPIEIAQNHRNTDEWVSFSKGKALIDNSDCLACHRIDVKSIGPSYLEVARKYDDNPKNQAMIANRIIKGSVGLWGDHAMSAHPDLSESDAALMVAYIMGLDDAPTSTPSIPLTGSYVLSAPPESGGKGGYLLRVAYTDKGTENLPSLPSEHIIALRNPVIDPGQYDDMEGMQILTTPRRSINAANDGAYLGYHDLDLTDIDEIVIGAEASPRVGAVGGIIEVRLSSPSGTLIGTTDQINAVEIDFRAKLRELKAAWEKGGKKGPEPNFRTARNKFRPKFAVPINTEIEGLQGIYFVFRNSNAKLGQILIQLNQIEFKQKSSGSGRRAT